MNGDNPQKSAAERRRKAIIAAVAPVLGVLGFFGIHTVGDLVGALNGDPPPTTSSSPPPTPPPAVVTTTTTTTTTTTVTTTTSDPPTTPPFDPRTWDSAATDRTPFTAAALLAPAFTSSTSTRFSLVASGGHPCAQAYGMGPVVQSVLTGNGCGATMTGDYLVNSATVTPNSNVLVSVQVIPFDTAAAATAAFTFLRDKGSWDFGLWCPNNGAGQQDCGPNYASARKYEHMRVFHRYLIEATAVYVNETTDAQAAAAVTPAAQQASQACGPSDP